MPKIDPRGTQPATIHVVAALNDLDSAFCMINRALNTIWGMGDLQDRQEKLAAKIARQARRGVSKEAWAEHVANDKHFSNGRGRGLEDWEDADK